MRESFPFPKSQIVFVILPFPIARDAVASNTTHIFQRVGFIFMLSRLLTFTPLMRRMISPSFGFTLILFDMDKGRTSVFPLLLRLPEITSRFTVNVHS